MSELQIWRDRCKAYSEGNSKGAAIMAVFYAKAPEDADGLAAAQKRLASFGPRI